jgi:hypothetical protein
MVIYQESLHDARSTKYKKLYRYASRNEGDTFWEMGRSAISSLYERHTVYLHTPR